MPRRLPRLVLAPVAVLAALALALALLGPAQAASISAKQVKKIAAKVVDKKAGSLSVARAARADTATTADTATNAANAAKAADATALAGRPASAYLSSGRKYSLSPTGTPAGSHVWTFPGLAPGTYLASYALSFDVPNPGDSATCAMRSTPSTPNELSAYGTTRGSTRTSVTASGILTVTPETVLQCAGTGDIASNITSSVSFVRLDEVAASAAAGTSS